MGPTQIDLPENQGALFRWQSIPALETNGQTGGAAGGRRSDCGGPSDALLIAPRGRWQDVVKLIKALDYAAVTIV